MKFWIKIKCWFGLHERSHFDARKCLWCEGQMIPYDPTPTPEEENWDKENLT